MSMRREKTDGKGSPFTLSTLLKASSHAYASVHCPCMRYANKVSGDIGQFPYFLTYHRRWPRYLGMFLCLPLQSMERFRQRLLVILM